MACVARGIECHLAGATFWQRNCEAVHAKKKGYLLRNDKLNADLINDTLLNASTHFQILFIKKEKKGHPDHEAFSCIFP